MNTKVEAFTNIAAEFLLDAIVYNHTAEQTEASVRRLYDEDTSEIVLFFINGMIGA